MSVMLECVICGDAHSPDAIATFKFFIQSRVCYKCYKKMRDAPFSQSCFGKNSTDNDLGYDGNARECRELCPDRKLCPHFASGKLIRLHTKAKDREATKPTKLSTTVLVKAYPFRTGSIADRAFKLCQTRVPKPKFKRWSMRQGTNMYRLLRAFRKEARYGIEWRWKETGGEYEIEYPLR